MRHLLLSLFFYISCLSVDAQNAHTVIAELQTINQVIANKLCNADSAAAISNRAMNIFLADKTGYLASNTDLSFYTNYVTLNSAEGRFTVNHNFQQPTTGNDAPIKRLLSIGFDMTIANDYSKSFLDKRFESELGVTANYKWLGKVRTRFTDCSQNNANQKLSMDALRYSLLLQLQTEITKKETDFIQSLNTIDSAALPGQDIAAAKKLMQQNFDAELKSAYEEKFATQQAAILTKTGNFKSVSTGWTSFTIYIPLLFPKYTVAPSLAASFNTRHPYALSVLLGHTRMWESSKAGRLFVTINASLLFNNSKLSYGLSKMNYSEYKSLGGTGILQTADPGNDKLYIGSYKTFLTPALTARFVYFPANSHIGVSFLAEQNFGDYNLLNFKTGIPIVLINSKKTPAVNIECYAIFLDIAKKMPSITKTLIGLSVGIPFSRLMY